MSKKRPREESYTDKLFKILERTTRLELVSAFSLRGFVFRVTTNQSESYIMKIVVLSPNSFDSSISLTKCTELVNSLKNQKKLTQKEELFKSESEIQNFIYNESKRGDRNPICPGVSYSVIYKCDISKDFLSLLDDTNKKLHGTNKNFSLFSFNPFRKTPEIDSVIKCLLHYFTQNFIIQGEKEPYFFRLGIILMDEIPECVTFYEFIHDNNLQEDKNLAYSNIYYQLIYLFLIIGVINFDMHRDNALVYRDRDIIKTLLIDFDWGDDLTYEEDSKYLISYEKRYINKIRTKLTEELNSIIFSYVESSPQSKINFIMKTMNILNIICWTSYRRDKNIKDKTIHKMDWFEPIQAVTEYMKDVPIHYRVDDNDDNNDDNNDDDDNEYEYDIINENDRIDRLIDFLMKKNDYTSTDGIAEDSFNILERNYKTTSTNFNKYTIPSIKEEGKDCNFSGGKKTSKSKRKYNTISYITCGKKSKIKTKRKPQKRLSRKHKRTPVR